MNSAPRASSRKATPLQLQAYVTFELVVWEVASRAGCSFRVKLGSGELFVESPLHPDERTLSDRPTGPFPAKSGSRRDTHHCAASSAGGSRGTIIRILVPSPGLVSKSIRPPNRLVTML